MTDEKQADQGKLTPEGASASCDSADPGLVEAVVERARRALVEARRGSSVVDLPRDGRTEIMIPGADSGRETTNPGSASVETETPAGDGTGELSAKLIADARRAISVEPEAAGEPGADQWYVSDLAVDCDTDTLLRVLARGLLAAGWLPPTGPLPEWCCPACGATTRARLADKVPFVPAAETEDACPHCSPTHAHPESRPWGVYIAPQVDGDGQPTHLVVQPSNGAHVAQSDADWLWQLIRNYRPLPDSEQRGVWQSPDGVHLAVEASDGELEWLECDPVGGWLLRGMLDMVPDEWVRLVRLPDSDTEWGIRPPGQGEVEETGTEGWARAVAARLPTLYVAVSRRPAGPWIEVPRG